MPISSTTCLRHGQSPGSCYGVNRVTGECFLAFDAAKRASQSGRTPFEVLLLKGGLKFDPERDHFDVEAINPDMGVQQAWLMIKALKAKHDDVTGSTLLDRLSPDEYDAFCALNEILSAHKEGRELDLSQFPGDDQLQMKLGG